MVLLLSGKTLGGCDGLQKSAKNGISESSIGLDCIQSGVVLDAIARAINVVIAVAVAGAVGGQQQATGTSLIRRGGSSN